LFEEEARRRMAQIADALATDDIAVIQDHAHALKSSAGTIGACRVAVLAQQLETAPLDEALARRVADFQACVADTKRALATLLQQRRLPLAPKE
jgi:HPt (histidine-containing phosphotransfer) domain-containing protein